MARQTFERFDGDEITDDMLAEASKLFNDNYGIWAETAPNPMPTPKPGMLG